METQEFKSKLKEIAGFLSNELSKVRSNRASPALVEDISVDYFGNKTPIKSMASISSLDARTLVIEPWDKSALEPIAKAIASASIGAQPIVDSKSVRISLPQLTQERRQELVKLVSQKMEEAKIRARRLRDDAVKSAQQEKSEDIKFRKKDEIEKAMKENNQALEDLKSKKEKELMS
ncbi:MAG: ribosome recycling factor [bacterium]|nr:ribosome recycling factor [bacterium]